MTRPVVLVVNAEERIGLAVIRSLGSAGYVVHAASVRVEAIGGQSHFAWRSVVCPEYADEQYLPWLRRYIREHSIGCIISGEDFLLAIRGCFDEFSRLLPMSQHEDVVYRGMSKWLLFAHLEGEGGAAAAHLAPTYRVHEDDASSHSDALLDGDSHVHLKADGMHARANAQSRTAPVRAGTDPRGLISQWLAHYDRLLVQRHVRGVGVGAFVLRWNGRVLARFMHRRLHELPGSGWSSLRESWWHDAIMRDAEHKLECLDWQGVAMMEYRYDADSDDFWLLEMNGRFWGSLHLALFAGVDFPRLLLGAFAGDTLDEFASADGRDGAPVRCRNTALEIKYVWSCLRDRSRPLRQRLWSVPEFIGLSLNPAVKSDLWYPGDRHLYWRQWLVYLRGAVRGGGQ